MNLALMHMDRRKASVARRLYSIESGLAPSSINADLSDRSSDLYQVALDLTDGVRIQCIHSTHGDGRSTNFKVTYKAAKCQLEKFAYKKVA